MLIARVTWVLDGWKDATLQYHEVFKASLILSYFEENAGTDALHTQLMTLDPRTSNVWRLPNCKGARARA